MKRLPTQTYQDIYEEKTPVEYLRGKLKLKHLEASNRFSKKYPHVEKFLLEKGIQLGKIREHSAKIIGAGALTSALLLGSPSNVGRLSAPIEVQAPKKGMAATANIPVQTPQEILVSKLNQNLPDKVRPLSQNEEHYLEGLFKSVVGVNSKATLEGEHLNTTYGFIGAEQHLYRYPGDTLAQHGTGQILSEGIAPGLGAWGYFAPSKDKLTPKLEEDEKWYAVVQTLYLPDWQARLPYLRDWYRYRKVLIVNTVNGNAVVADVADSGPAAWTGKVYGGSPEVMYSLGGPNYKKGPVILFFVDDPDNKVPLGPVDYSKLDLSGIALQQL